MEAILMRTHKIPISIWKGKSTQIISNLQLWDFFLGTQERVRNSHGKRAISVRALKFYCSSLSLYCEEIAKALLILSALIQNSTPNSTNLINCFLNLWYIYFFLFIYFFFNGLLLPYTHSNFFFSSPFFFFFFFSFSFFFFFFFFSKIISKILKLQISPALLKFLKLLLNLWYILFV